jgi:4-hydroxy-tetrahydrodipicolinate synthase
LSVDSIVSLAEEPNIVGIKDTSQDSTRWARTVSQLRHNDNFSVLVGTELLIPVGLMLGADGAVGGAHNFAPRLAVDLYDAFQKGNYSKAFEISEQLTKLCKLFEYADIWGAFEVALQYLGIVDKVTASPYRSATAEEREKVLSILKESGLKAGKAQEA